MPSLWNIKCIHPIYKDINKLDPSNYRPVAVATTYYKLFTSVLGHRLSNAQDAEGNRFIGDNQFAFRKQFSVEHNHIAIITSHDVAKKQGKPLLVLKLDISKAYDTVDRDTM